MAALSGARLGVCARPLPSSPLALEAGWGRRLLFLISGRLSLLWNAFSLFTTPHPLLPARIDQTQMAPLHGRQKP